MNIIDCFRILARYNRLANERLSRSVPHSILLIIGSNGLVRLAAYMVSLIMVWWATRFGWQGFWEEALLLHRPSTLFYSRALQS